MNRPRTHENSAMAIIYRSPVKRDLQRSRARFGIGCIRMPLHAVLLATLAMLSGCSFNAPYAYIPYPDTVIVTHPRQVEDGEPEDKLRERYTVSPLRNPDGLGTMITIEPNSQMTLIVLQMDLDRQARNRPCPHRCLQKETSSNPGFALR